MNKAIFIICGIAFFLVSSSAPAARRADDSGRYLAWWDREYKGADAAAAGSTAYQKGDYKKAAAELEDAVKGGESSGRIYYQLAYSYQQTGRADKAVDLYAEAIKLLDKQSPKDKYAYYARYNLGFLYKNAGDTDKALSLMEDTVKRFPKKASSRNLLGWLYWNKGDRDAAVREFKLSLEIDPGQGDVQYNLGILEGGGANKAQHNKGTSSSALFKKALSYSRAGRPGNAAQIYLSIIREDPENAEAHYNLAVLYDNDIKNESRAVYHYRRYLDINPGVSDRQQVESRINLLLRRI